MRYPSRLPPALDRHDRARHVCRRSHPERGAVHQRDRSGPAEERLTAQGSGLSCDTCRTPPPLVDGTANDRTLITLSHWRRSGTPADLMADTSTAIVFNYLDRPDLHVPADIVSNNHFDEAGLVGIYALLEPAAAASRRDLLIDGCPGR